MFLSQPGMAMFASYHWPPITVSMESAMTSRDCSENDMPDTRTIFGPKTVKKLRQAQKINHASDNTRLVCTNYTVLCQ